MAEVAKLVGKEAREFTGQDGKQHIYCKLHLVHLEGSFRRVNGCKVEVLSCPREVDPESLKVGTTYQLVYENWENKENKKIAVLVDLLEVET